MKDEILELVDRIENIEEAMKMPISAEMHLECVGIFLVELKDKLKEIAE